MEDYGDDGGWEEPVDDSGDEELKEPVSKYECMTA